MIELQRYRDKKIRVNTISQSPTRTTAGSGVKGIDTLIDFTERMSPLGNADAEDCANYCITLFILKLYQGFDFLLFLSVTPARH